MKATLLGSLLLLASFCTAQTPAPPATQQPNPTPAVKPAEPPAHPEDIQNIPSIVNTLYAVISGPPGERDWQRFHALFIPEARLIFNGKNASGKVVRRVMSPDDYQQRAGELFKKEGFFESTISNKMEQYGHIAQVFSTYESRHEKDAKPFARGINSIQLAFDGQRWWVVTIMWDQESPDNLIPEQFLKGNDLAGRPGN